MRIGTEIITHMLGYEFSRYFPSSCCTGKLLKPGPFIAGGMPSCFGQPPNDTPGGRNFYRAPANRFHRLPFQREFTFQPRRRLSCVASKKRLRACPLPDANTWYPRTQTDAQGVLSFDPWLGSACDTSFLLQWLFLTLTE